MQASRQYLWDMVRIGLFLMIPVGYAMTHQFYEQQQDEYLALNVLDFVVMLLLLMSLPRIRPANIMICILLMIFAVGYFFKFYWLAYMFEHGASAQDLALLFLEYSKWLTRDLAYQAFETLAFSFAIFGISSVLWLRIFAHQSAPGAPLPACRIDAAHVQRILLVALLCAVVSGIPRYVFHLGAPDQGLQLPFHLQGVLFFINQSVTPCLIGLALVLAMRSEETRLVRKVLGWFVIWSLLQFALFTSKSVLLLPLLWYALARMAGGIRDTFIDRLIAAAAALFVLAFPFLNLYRLAKSTPGVEVAGQLFDQLSFYIQTIAPDMSSLSDFVLFGLSGIFIRTVGFGELMGMHVLADAFPHDMVPYLLSGSSPGDLFTSISGYGGGHTGLASSLLGQAYFVSGSNIATALWLGVVIFLAQSASRRLLARSTPLGLALWIVFVINVTFWFVDELGLPKLLFLVLVMLAVSLVFRLVVGREAPAIALRQPAGSRHDSAAPGSAE